MVLNECRGGVRSFRGEREKKALKKNRIHSALGYLKILFLGVKHPK